MKNELYKQPLIFIVDDDEDDLYFIKSALLNSIPNSTVKCFSHGRQLLDNLNEYRSNLPSFILMDLNMPVLNGKETLKSIHKDNRLNQIPVVIFSTSNNPNEKAHCFQYGATSYHCKPSSVIEYDEIMQGLKRQYIDRVAVS